LEWTLLYQSPKQLETECLCVDVAGYKIINVGKPPRSRFTPTSIPTFPHPSPYVGNFNYQHVNWSKTSDGMSLVSKTSDGENLESWVTANNLGLL